MIINKEIIGKFNPCKERFDNFIEQYPTFNGSFDEFLDLENITYEDKIWVAKKVLNKNQLVHFGILCAESVLNIFEAKYPEDKRVRNCIELLKSKKDFSILSSEEKEEIWKARNEARFAATYAADAATYAVHAATYAAYAAYAADHATYAVHAATHAVHAADAAAYVTYAYAAKKNQRNLNLEYLKMAASL